MSDRNKFGYADKLSAEEAAATLESLAKALKEGHVSLRAAGEAISLVPSDMVKMKIEAGAGSTSGSVTFSVSWKPEYVRGVNKLVAASTPGISAPIEPAVEPLAPVEETAQATVEHTTQASSGDSPSRSASKPRRTRSNVSARQTTRRKRTTQQ